jgi:hypothetical protein
MGLSLFRSKSGAEFCRHDDTNEEQASRAHAEAEALRGATGMQLEEVPYQLSENVSPDVLVAAIGGILGVARGRRGH